MKKTRNTLGQYAKGKLPVGTILGVVAILVIAIAIYTSNKKQPVATTVPVGDATFVQEDPRIAEYLASEEAKLQAKLSIYEKDRLEAISTNKANNAQMKLDYEVALKEELERNAKEMFKINANLDSIRKEQLEKAGIVSVKGH